MVTTVYLSFIQILIVLDKVSPCAPSTLFILSFEGSRWKHRNQDRNLRSFPAVSMHLKYPIAVHYDVSSLTSRPRPLLNRAHIRYLLSLQVAKSRGHVFLPFFPEVELTNPKTVNKWRHKCRKAIAIQLVVGHTNTCHFELNSSEHEAEGSLRNAQ
jgi:hypothetical protein